MGYRTELHLAFCLADEPDWSAYSLLLHLTGRKRDPEVDTPFGWFCHHAAAYHATCIEPTLHRRFVQIGTHAKTHPEDYLEVVRALSPCMDAFPTHIGHIRGEDEEVWVLFRNPVTGYIDVTKVGFPDYDL